MELTNKAIGKLIEKTVGKHNTVRVAYWWGCAGMEYVFKYNEPIDNDPTDTVSTMENSQYGLMQVPTLSYSTQPSTMWCVESMNHLKSSTPLKNQGAVVESQ